MHRAKISSRARCLLRGKNFRGAGFQAILVAQMLPTFLAAVDRNFIGQSLASLKLQLLFLFVRLRCEFIVGIERFSFTRIVQQNYYPLNVTRV